MFSRLKVAIVSAFALIGAHVLTDADPVHAEPALAKDVTWSFSRWWLLPTRPAQPNDTAVMARSHSAQAAVVAKQNDFDRLAWA